MKYLFASLFFLLTSLSSSAQGNSSISGRVVGVDHSAIFSATIMLYRAADTSLLRANFSELNGAFSFDELEADTYLLKSTHLGFEPFWSQAIKLGEEQTLTIQSAILVELAEVLD
ncbi:MAG: carboxypeptidase regulatory-like domain-containing protein [Saprospiraceae bacterium]|nr:carboxypeptidase regulatory-like domain-containing protein [Saprospiraceae bacterium]